MLLAQSLPSTEMESVTAVTQLSDVQPSDWAYQALQALIDRHQCLPSTSDNPPLSEVYRTFKGNQPLIRTTFAITLQACLDNLIPKIKFSNSATQEDLQIVNKLQSEFTTELATLKQKLATLETKNNAIEKQQFSTTTKLFGQAILGLQGRTRNTADLNPRDGIPDTPDPTTGTTFGYSSQLSLYTQLSSRSIVLLGLSAGNLSTAANSNNPPYFLNDTYTRLAYESNSDNQIRISDATWRFLVSDRLAFIIGATGVNPVSVFRGPNRYESAGSGPISSFAQRNPIINLGGQAGLGFDWQPSRRLSLQGVYSAGSGIKSASDPSSGNGLFNGPNTLGFQLAAIPLPTLDWTTYYLTQYNPSANLGTGIGDDLIGFVDARFRTHAWGSTLSWRATKGFTLGGWVGHTRSNVLVPSYSGSVETFNWMLYANFPDLFKQGNLGGLYFGQPPRIVESDLALNGIPTLNIPNTISGRNGIAGGQPGNTYHLEAFYRWQLNPNLSITPGAIVLFNPAQTQSSDSIVVGTIRTTFTF
jgi:Carbohydrate-selective porin, OprB family